MMNYQSESHQWGVPGAAWYVSLPQAAPQVGWFLVNAEAEGIRSVEPMQSYLSQGNSLLILPNNTTEDGLYSQPFPRAEPKALVSPFRAGRADDFNFDDLGLLPSSPESIDFSDLSDMDAELLTLTFENISDPTANKFQDAFEKHLDEKAELRVEDPEVALNLLQRLDRNADQAFQSINVLPSSDDSLVSDQTSIPSAFKLSAAPTNETNNHEFQTDSFFSLPHDSRTCGRGGAVEKDFDDEVEFGCVDRGGALCAADAMALSEFLVMSNLQQPSLSPSTRSSSSASPVNFGGENNRHDRSRKCKAFKPEKKQRKKEQNKTAALKYRQKKRSEHGSFVNECQETERKNAELKLRVSEITREISYLKTLLLEISVI